VTSAWLGRLAGGVAELLLPQRCVVCGGFGAALHEECVEALPRAAGARCPRCWRPGEPALCVRCVGEAPLLTGVDALRAPFRFDGAARGAILEAKFGGVTALLPPLARAAAACVPPGWDVQAVVPVPLAPRRERRRGFNQADVAARTVAGALGRPLEPLLRRDRDTAPQSTLGAAARAANLAGAFSARGVAPARVLVVDDVTTTGATLGAAAEALRAAGATRVYGLALARED